MPRWAIHLDQPRCPDTAIREAWRHTVLVRTGWFVGAWGATPLRADALFQFGHPVASHLQFGRLGILEADQQLAAEPRIDFADPRNVDQRGAVDADELPRIELLFQFRHRVVHHVTLAVHGGIGQFVAREEVRDARDFQQLYALAQPRRDAFGIRHGGGLGDTD